MSYLFSKKINSIIWIFFEKFGSTLASFISFFIYATILSISEIGTVTVALSITMGLGQVLCTLFQDPINCLKKLKLLVISSTIYGCLCISLFIVLLLIVVINILSINETLLTLIIISSFLVILIPLNGIFTALLRRKRQYKKIAKYYLISKISSISIGLSLAYIGFGAVSMLLQAVLLEVLVFMLLIVNSNQKFIPKFSFNELSMIARLGSSIALRKLSWEGYIKGIPLVLNAYLGPAAAGLFTFAWRVVDMPRTALVSGSISYVLPLFTKKTTTTELREAFISVSKVSVIFFSPIFICIALYIEPLLNVFFADKWNDAVPIIQGICIYTVFTTTRMYVPTIFTVILKPQIALKADVISTGIALISMVLLLPYLGVFACVISFLVRMLANMPFSINGIKKELQLTGIEQFSIHSLAVISLFLMVIISFLLSQYIKEYEYSFIIIGSCSSLFYILIVSYLERGMFKSMYRRVI